MVIGQAVGLSFESDEIEAILRLEQDFDINMSKTHSKDNENGIYEYLIITEVSFRDNHILFHSARVIYMLLKDLENLDFRKAIVFGSLSFVTLALIDERDTI